MAGATPIMPIRASIDGSFFNFAIADGVVWAVDHGAGVINMSFGDPVSPIA